MLWALLILGLLVALAVASRLSAQKAEANYPPGGKSSSRGVHFDDSGERAVGLALNWMKVHGKRLYNFTGIENYKAKMQPDEWIPVYAVVRGRWKLRHIGAIIEAFTGERPMRAIGRFTWTAFCQELR